MSKDTSSPLPEQVKKFRQICIAGGGKCITIVKTRVIPATRKGSAVCIQACQQHLFPALRKGSHRVRHEVLKIHQKQNLFKRFGATMLDNSIGLITALLAGRIVQHFVEVSEFSNLWGILSDKPVVSETTFEILNFGVEFVIILFTFTLTEHYLSEYRERKNRNANNDDDEPGYYPR